MQKSLPAMNLEAWSPWQLPMAWPTEPQQWSSRGWLGSSQPSRGISGWRTEWSEAPQPSSQAWPL